MATRGFASCRASAQGASRTATRFTLLDARSRTFDPSRETSSPSPQLETATSFSADVALAAYVVVSDRAGPGSFTVEDSAPAPPAADPDGATAGALDDAGVAAPLDAGPAPAPGSPFPDAIDAVDGDGDDDDDDAAPGPAAIAPFVGCGSADGPCGCCDPPPCCSPSCGCPPGTHPSRCRRRRRRRRRFPEPGSPGCPV